MWGLFYYFYAENNRYFYRYYVDSFCHWVNSKYEVSC